MKTTLIILSFFICSFSFGQHSGFRSDTPVYSRIFSATGGSEIGSDNYDTAFFNPKTYNGHIVINGIQNIQDFAVIFCDCELGYHIFSWEQDYTLNSNASGYIIPCMCGVIGDSYFVISGQFVEDWMCDTYHQGYTKTPPDAISYTFSDTIQADYGVNSFRHGSNKKVVDKIDLIEVYSCNQDSSTWYNVERAIHPINLFSTYY